MTALRNILTAALVALPLATFASLSADAGPRRHSDRGSYGYNDNRGYTQHNRSGWKHRRMQRRWQFNRAHSGRRHGGWRTYGYR